MCSYDNKLQMKVQMQISLYLQCFTMMSGEKTKNMVSKVSWIWNKLFSKKKRGGGCIKLCLQAANELGMESRVRFKIYSVSQIT